MEMPLNIVILIVPLLVIFIFFKRCFRKGVFVFLFIGGVAPDTNFFSKLIDLLKEKFLQKGD